MNKKSYDCSICLESISEYDCTRTNCGHLFHPSCFWKWCKTSNQCPNCRADLMEKDRDAELNLVHLLDSRKNIINQVEEAYEELDSIREELEYVTKQNMDRNKKLGKLDAEINISETYLKKIQAELNYFKDYKKNPDGTFDLATIKCDFFKVLKNLTKRNKKIKRKKDFKISKSQRKKKYRMLKELKHNKEKAKKMLYPNLNLFSIKNRELKQKMLNELVVHILSFNLSMNSEYFTKNDLKLFEEDQSNYKFVTNTPCTCSICNSQGYDKCSDHFKFCKNHHKIFCEECGWCFEHEFYCKKMNCENDDCIINPEQLYDSMPELEEIPYDNISNSQFEFRRPSQVYAEFLPFLSEVL